MKLTTHLHLVPRSKNAWSYNSASTWQGTQLKKHRDNFTFIFWHKTNEKLQQIAHDLEEMGREEQQFMSVASSIIEHHDYQI
jgi:hypothetical protein